MATFVQFLTGTTLRHVTVIAGDSAPIRQLALDEIIDQLDLPSVAVEHFDAQVTTTKTLLTELAREDVLNAQRLIVYSNVESANELWRLKAYIAAPTDGTFLILTAPRLRSEATKERWIPSDKRVLYIDCNELSEKATVNYCRYEGLDAEDAAWLVDRHAADLTEIIRAMDLLAVFKVKPSGLIRELVPTVSRADEVQEKYVIRNADTDWALYQSLRIRLQQLVILADNLEGQRLPLQELATRADMHQFVAIRLLPLARSKPPSHFFRQLCALIRYEHHARNDMIGYRECLATFLL